MVLQLLTMVGQCARRPGEVEALEPLDPALLELAEVAAQGILGDPRQSTDLLVGEALALEVDGLYLQSDAGVGVMEPFVVQGVDRLGGEVDA